ncbi:MAG: hypothetical protein V2J12_07470 [Gammaproteobacteria bacterium]|jgi:hypothetical protein|nr:hypothetical protein [Gammaproteobacteria bacterium]
MHKPISAGVLFAIIWRSWTLGVLLIFVPVSLLGVPALLATEGVTALGQFSLILMFVPFAAVLQGGIIGALVCLGYMVLPTAWLGLSDPDPAATD